MTYHEKPTFTIKKLECGRPIFRVDKIGKRHFSKYLSWTCWVCEEKRFQEWFQHGHKKNPLPLRNGFWHWIIPHPLTMHMLPASPWFLSASSHPSDMSIGHVGKSPSLGVWWHEEPDSTKYSSPQAGPEKWLEALTHRMSCRKQSAASSIVAPQPSSRPKLYPLLTEGAHRKLPQPVLAVRLMIQSGLIRVGSLVPSGRLDWYKRP